MNANPGDTLASAIVAAALIPGVALVIAALIVS